MMFSFQDQEFRIKEIKETETLEEQGNINQDEGHFLFSSSEANGHAFKLAICNGKVYFKNH